MSEGEGVRTGRRSRPLAWAPLLAAALLSCRSTPETDEELIAAFLKDNPYVYEKLDSQDARRRQDVVDGLLAIPERRHAQTILRFLLDDRNLGPGGRMIVAGLLATEFKDARAVPALVEGLQAPGGFARGVAIEALRAYGERVIPQVAEIYATGLEESREAAAEVLAGIGTRAAIDALRSRLASEGSPEVRAAAVLGILEYDGKESVDYMIDCLADPDVEIRWVVWNALRRRANPPAAFDPDGTLEARASQIAELRLWRKRGQESTAGR